MNPAKNCKVCGIEFTQAHTRGRPKVYCSAKCKIASRPYQRKKQKNECCAFCNQPFEAAISSQKYCNDVCRNRSYLIRQRNRTLLRSIECRQCGEMFPREKGRDFRKFCDECKRRRNQDYNAAKNHKRRARGPLVSLSELVQARGERCHICRRKVDLSLSGLHKMGPTIDHILPVSMGGTNEIANLNLAHRICNVRRSNRGPAQMILEATDAWTATKAG